ncbi:MAG TPA: Asp-tRNA(Asn)/Glu-tRNA(Gln) amidotransferase subunit GatA, partial [Sediminispirochaeta sp.]|nr:Asp-tRNA(Asn)/Glu-tRNA(Gln) amidotransferase subunit GatA [Sediminispirochaeta sp.]
MFPRERTVQIDSQDKIERYAADVRDLDRTIGAFLEFDPRRRFAPSRAGSLAGVPVAVKDNIAVEGFRLSCGSRFLADFRSPYSATAIRKLEEAGALI